MPTYYVDWVDGADINAGTSEGSGNAWKTMDHAANQVIAGDIVYVKASGSYLENCDCVTSGTAADPIVWIGYTTTPGDGGQVTVDGESSRSVLSFTTNGSYQVFRNFIFQNSVGSGAFFNTPDNLRFENCTFQNNTSQGVHCDSQTTFVNCSFLGNAANGMFSTSGSGIRVVGCRAGNNSNIQLDWNGTSTTNGLCARNVIYGIPNNALYPGIFTYAPVIGCTFDGEGNANSIGLQHQNSFAGIFDCIFYDCNVGVSNNAVGIESASVYNNHFHSCTTKYSTSKTWWEDTDTSGDPLFTNEAGDDYSLAAGSPCLDAGIGQTT